MNIPHTKIYIILLAKWHHNRNENQYKKITDILISYSKFINDFLGRWQKKKKNDFGKKKSEFEFLFKGFLVQ